jgi:hypothetical protein
MNSNTPQSTTEINPNDLASSRLQQYAKLGIPTEFTNPDGSYQKFVPVHLYLDIPYDDVMDMIKNDVQQTIKCLTRNLHLGEKLVQLLSQEGQKKQSLIEQASKIIEDVYTTKKDVRVFLLRVLGSYIKTNEFEKVGIDEEHQQCIDSFVNFFKVSSYKIILICDDYPNLAPVLFNTSFSYQ